MTQLEEKGFAKCLTQGLMVLAEDYFIVIAPSGFSISPLNVIRFMEPPSDKLPQLNQKMYIKNAAKFLDVYRILLICFDKHI